MWKPVIDRQMERKWMYLQVLQLIQQYGAISRVEIANKLHMTRASVTLLIHEMMEKGVLEDIGTCPTSEGKGRRKIIDGCASFSLAADWYFHSGESFGGWTDNLGHEYAGKAVHSVSSDAGFMGIHTGTNDYNRSPDFEEQLY